jgi:UDP-N-acetylmuramate: L-alanyl-gamma-D-glutamyl-meso-diaminopimelate ligase
VTRHVHFLGIAGYAVSGAALMAQQLGYTVTGSDEDAYPPTTEVLTAAGISWKNHHAAENLDLSGAPDLVVVGNQVRAGNVEWEAAVARGLPITSEAEFYAELTRERLRIAVCGTHGKTTTASLAAWMLESAGMAPGFRLGTTSRDFGASARLGDGAPFVFEGDEYTTAPWDPRPKFLHIHPQLACVTRLELDHPDVFPSFEAYRAPFVELVRGMPRDGTLLLCADDAACLALGAHAACPVETYSTAGAAADWTAAGVETAEHPGSSGLRDQRFAVRGPGDVDLRVTLPLPGAHNRQNAIAALALATHAGADPARCATACADFRGPSRRFEIVASVDGVAVVDDYAHHPTEVAATVAAARSRFASVRQLIALYVPHTYSRTLALLEQYATSFTGADLVLLGPIEPARERHLAHTVSTEDVAAQARRSAGDVRVVATPEEAILVIAETAQRGDVVLCMSVRGFDDIARRTVAALEARHALR